MSVVVTLALKAKPETYAQLAATIQTILPDTAARPGAELIRAAGDPATHTVHLYEVWDRIESQQSYFAWRAERGDLDRLGALLASPPEVRTLDNLF